MSPSPSLLLFVNDVPAGPSAGRIPPSLLLASLLASSLSLSSPEFLLEKRPESAVVFVVDAIVGASRERERERVRERRDREVVVDLDDANQEEEENA
mmetsp:Transcript_9320/g.20204  ORF Transcript_9320/g.20204 Transcript_9320/m.20204 type:complete len:97 (+) Transcript_9320:733-1023(+)